MRVLLLTHYYPPERGAPQTRLHETACELVRLGHAVRVVTGPPHYPDGVVRSGYPWWRSTHEAIDGIPVQRLPMLPRPNRGLVDRTLDHASFSLAAAAAVAPARWADVVVVDSPPLFLGLTAAWYRLGLRRPYLFHVADPWPDFPIAMGALSNPVAQRLAFAIEDVAYRHANLITTVTPGLVDLLDRKPAAHGRVRLLPNAVDVGRFTPDRSPVDARASLGWPEARLTLVYAGSVGLAQGVRSLIDAVAPLREEGVVLHLVGEGYEQAHLASEARERGLDHVRFHPPVEAGEVPTVLAAADAIVVLLRAGPLYAESLPTKLLEGLAAGRPIILSAAGESARLVRQGEAGLVVEPERPDELRGAIRQVLHLDRRGLGAAALRVAAGYDRRLVVGRLGEYLTAITRDRRATPRSRRPPSPARS